LQAVWCGNRAIWSDAMRSAVRRSRNRVQQSRSSVRESGGMVTSPWCLMRRVDVDGALVNRYGAAFVESFAVERAVWSSLRRAWSLRSGCRLCYSRSMMRQARSLVWSIEPYDLVSEKYCRPIARYPRLRATLKSSHPATSSARSVAWSARCAISCSHCEISSARRAVLRARRAVWWHRRAGMVLPSPVGDISLAMYRRPGSPPDAPIGEYAASTGEHGRRALVRHPILLVRVLTIRHRPRRYTPRQRKKLVDASITPGRVREGAQLTRT
jgi:hypothetical protein